MNRLDLMCEWETKPPRSIEFPGAQQRQGMCRWLKINLYFLPLMELHDKLETVIPQGRARMCVCIEKFPTDQYPNFSGWRVGIGKCEFKALSQNEWLESGWMSMSPDCFLIVACIPSMHSHTYT